MTSTSSAMSIAFFWPGIILFFILFCVSFIGLRYYARMKQSRSILFWIIGIVGVFIMTYILTLILLTVTNLI